MATSKSPLMSFKSQIFLNNRIHPWSNIATIHNALLLLHPSSSTTRTRTRFSPFHIPLFSHLIPLHFRHRNLHLRLGSPSFSPPMSSLASSSPPTDSSPTKTVRVVIKGRVQGVFYRDWTVENAREFGLNGWVRNRRDGCVEALFSGSDENVREMEQRCRRGPPSAMVTALDVVPCSDDPGTGFRRTPTV